jgi:hypothetical protein
VTLAGVTSFVHRDVDKAAEALRGEVNRELASGWEPHGGVASVQAGAGVHLIQALVRR